MPRPLRTWVRGRLYPRLIHIHPDLSRWRPDQQSLLAWVRYEAGFHYWRLTQNSGRRLERPIFMIGCPRSGTTIAANLFGLHPDVANLSEAPEIWDPRHYLDSDADHYWRAEDVTREDAARLHARFEYHRRWEVKPRFFNKYPRSSVRIDYIRTIFPDAVFLHVIRDGRAVAASMLAYVESAPPGWLGPMPFCHPANWRQMVREDKLEQVALQWRAVVSHILGKAAELGPAYHAFKYEELCEEPRRVLSSAYRFAGLRADPDVLALLPERLEVQNYKWKRNLSPKQIQMLDRVQGFLLTELGYGL